MDFRLTNHFGGAGRGAIAHSRNDEKPLWQLGEFACFYNAQRMELRFRARLFVGEQATGLFTLRQLPASPLLGGPKSMVRMRVRIDAAFGEVTVYLGRGDSRVRCSTSVSRHLLPHYGVLHTRSA